MIYSINNFLLKNIPLSPVNCMHCDDNYVGTIEYDGRSFKGYKGGKQFGLQRNAKCSVNKSYNRSKIDYNAFNAPNTYRKIVILLESPHVNEFKPVTQIGLLTAPALGNSGNRFNSQCINVFNNNIGVLRSVLSLSNNLETFGVYFVNAIQYQCSLGQQPINSQIRDFVFEALWNRQPNSFKDDLIERLNIIKPDLIINACTRELQKICCNGSSICAGLNGFGYSFLTASNHISVWNTNTIIL